MTRRTQLGLSAFVLAAVLAGWWTVQSRSASAPESVAAPASPAVDPARASDAVALPESAAIAAGARSTIAKEDDAAADEVLDPADARMLTGRIEYPAGAPAEANLQVVAYDDDFDEPLGSARVAADGAFSIAVPKSADSARLGLRARFLCLDPEVELDFEQPVEPLLLRPILGGCIRGRLVAANTTTSDAAALGEMTLTVAVREFLYPTGAWQSRPERTVHVDEAGRFELGSLSPQWKLALSWDSEEFLSGFRAAVQVTAGDCLDIEIPVIRATRIAGTVADTSGAPLEDVDVWCSIERAPSARPPGDDSEYHHAKSDAEGRFELAGMRGGQTRLSLGKPGFVSMVCEPMTLAQGERRSGLSFALDSGHRLAGVVHWPDGTPAAGCRLLANPLSEPIRSQGNAIQRQFEWASISDADGRFEIQGLDSGAYRVIAESSPPLSSAGVPASASAASPATLSIHDLRGSDHPPQWRAVCERAQADSANLELVLREPIVLAGRVIDERGEPVTEFRISAYPQDSLTLVGGLQGEFESADGGFRLLGFHAGTWDLRLSAAGHNPAQLDGIALPQAGGPLDIVCARAASITGTVVDPDGAPVPGAKVSMTPEPELFGGQFDSDAVAADDGTFRFEMVPAGLLMLSAVSDRFAAAEHSLVTTAPGAELAGVVLRLRKGGRIEGEIAEGNPARARRPLISLREPRDPYGRATTLRADAQGAFRFERLPPGLYEVSLQAGDALAAPDSARGDESTETASASADCTALVRLEEGATAHVVLGDAGRAPVAITGTVTSGGRPLADARVELRLEAERFNRAEHVTRTDEDGRYAIELDDRGDASFTVTPAGGGVASLFHARIPDEERFTYDIALPGGSIAGRVLGADGKPLAGVALALEPDDKYAHQFSRVGYGRATSGADGCFRFEHLPVAVYSVRAEVASSEPAYGARRRDDLDLRARPDIDDVELVLGAAARLAIRAHAVDGPLAGALTVLVRDADGRLVRRPDPVQRDASGAFAIAGLPEGRYWIGASSGWKVSAADVEVVLRDGESRALELELIDGARVVVALADAQGLPLDLEARAYDSRGFLTPRTMAGYDETARERLLGPLSPGAWRVVGDTGDGRNATRQVVLAAGQTERLDLRLSH